MEAAKLSATRARTAEIESESDDDLSIPTVNSKDVYSGDDFLNCITSTELPLFTPRIDFSKWKFPAVIHTSVPAVHVTTRTQTKSEDSNTHTTNEDLLLDMNNIDAGEIRISSECTRRSHAQDKQNQPQQKQIDADVSMLFSDDSDEDVDGDAGGKGDSVVEASTNAVSTYTVEINTRPSEGKPAGINTNAQTTCTHTSNISATTSNTKTDVHVPPTNDDVICLDDDSDSDESQQKKSQTSLFSRPASYPVDVDMEMEVASSRSARTQTNPVSNIAPTPTPTNNSRQRRKHIRIIQNDNTTATTATALASNVEIVDLCAMDEGEFAPVPVSPQSERRRRRRQRQRQRKRQKTHQAGKNRQDEDVIVLD